MNPETVDITELRAWAYQEFSQADPPTFAKITTLCNEVARLRAPQRDWAMRFGWFLIGVAAGLLFAALPQAR